MIQVLGSFVQNFRIIVVEIILRKKGTKMVRKEKDNNLLSEKRKKLYAKYLKVIGLGEKVLEIKKKEFVK